MVVSHCSKLSHGHPNCKVSKENEIANCIHRRSDDTYSHFTREVNEV